ncbi:DinB family protein [Serinicoccus sediminis]|uniref:DinB family protein n=1 Tax=Serinicoccus sediminis TaxID=2306021 RepID=UPI00192D2781|nr:DinB family protein [Serinicoccus sediminis]
MDPAKDTLLRYLQAGRDAVVWKVEGLGEHDARRPLTPTGTSMLGIVTHLAWVDCGYLGACFGRPFPEPEPWDLDDPATDPDADLVADPDLSMRQILDHYRRAAAWSDETVAPLELDAPGTVPWWPQERRHPTLHTVLVHLTTETHRHAGQLDILREGLDGRVGARPDLLNLDMDTDWAAHVAAVQEAADRFR